MRKLIGKLEVADPFGNQKTLKFFCDREEGTIDYSLTNEGRTSFSISNLQCGWRGPLLPDNTYEYETNKILLEAIVKAIKGGVYNVVNAKLFVE
jgi:hypothetical protein